MLLIPQTLEEFLIKENNKEIITLFMELNILKRSHICNGCKEVCEYDKFKD